MDRLADPVQPGAGDPERRHRPDRYRHRLAGRVAQQPEGRVHAPERGNAEEACKEEVIVVQENIKSLLNDNSSDIDSILFIAGQNIDVFNKSSEFYTSICYHFDSPCDKDVALKDRLLIYYPNITLCDSGCKNTGVNLTSMMAICECKFKEISNNDTEEK